MKTQKGITLIALIITIIVMLILVGVSVSVALNTGLFKTAQGAARNTQLAADEETAISNGTINVDGKGEIDIDEYVASLTGPKLTITGPSGSFEYAITEDTTFADLINNYPDDFAVKTVTHGFGTSDFVAWNDIFIIAYDGSTDTTYDATGQLPNLNTRLMYYKTYSNIIFATGNISDFFELAGGVKHMTLSGYGFNISE